MARSKGYCFSASHQAKAAYFNALRHPARVQIVELLHNGRSIFFEELVEILPLSSGAISEHLRKLEDVNLIIPSPSGFGRTGYRLNNAAVAEALQLSGQTLRHLTICERVEDAA